MRDGETTPAEHVDLCSLAGLDKWIQIGEYCLKKEIVFFRSSWKKISVCNVQILHFWVLNKIHV